jgi:hypothetical protein
MAELLVLGVFIGFALGILLSHIANRDAVDSNTEKAKHYDRDVLSLRRELLRYSDALRVQQLKNSTTEDSEV